MFGVDERGSVLMLMPAAVLVLVVMGAVAVDSAIAFMAQRELQNAVAAAANDAAVAAIDEERFYACGSLDVTSDRAEDVVLAAFTAGLPETIDVVGAPDVIVAGGDANRPVQVTVSARGRVDLLFAPAVGGLARRELTATSTAVGRLPTGATAPADDC